MGFTNLFGGSELVGEGDLFNARLVIEGFKLCVGLLPREGGAGGLPLTVALVGPFRRFPEFGRPGGGSLLKLGLFPPVGGVGGGPPVGLLLLGGGAGSPLLP